MLSRTVAQDKINPLALRHALAQHLSHLLQQLSTGRGCAPAQPQGAHGLICPTIAKGNVLHFAFNRRRWHRQLRNQGYTDTCSHQLPQRFQTSSAVAFALNTPVSLTNLQGMVAKTVAVFQQQYLFALEVLGGHLTQPGLGVARGNCEHKRLVEQGELCNIFLAQGQGQQGSVKVSLLQHA